MARPFAIAILFTALVGCGAHTHTRVSHIAVTELGPDAEAVAARLEAGEVVWIAQSERGLRLANACEAEAGYLSRPVHRSPQWATFERQMGDWKVDPVTESGDVRPLRSVLDSLQPSAPEGTRLTVEAVPVERTQLAYLRRSEDVRCVGATALVIALERADFVVSRVELGATRRVSEVSQSPLSLELVESPVPLTRLELEPPPSEHWELLHDGKKVCDLPCGLSVPDVSGNWVRLQREGGAEAFDWDAWSAGNRGSVTGRVVRERDPFLRPLPVGLALLGAGMLTFGVLMPWDSQAGAGSPPTSPSAVGRSIADDVGPRIFKLAAIGLGAAVSGIGVWYLFDPRKPYAQLRLEDPAGSHAAPAELR